MRWVKEELTFLMTTFLDTLDTVSMTLILLMVFLVVSLLTFLWLS